LNNEFGPANLDPFEKIRVVTVASQAQANLGGGQQQERQRYQREAKQPAPTARERLAERWRVGWNRAAIFVTGFQVGALYRRGARFASQMTASPVWRTRNPPGQTGPDLNRFFVATARVFGQFSS
jgi:hypothetical protein